MAIIDIIFIVIAIIILVIAGIFSVLAAMNVKKDPNYEGNDILKKARNRLIWSSVIIWVGLALVLAALGLSFYFTGKDSNAVKQAEAAYATGDYISALNLFPRGSSGKLVRVLLLGFTFFIILISGILAATAASTLRSSKITAGPANSAYTQSIIVSILTLGGMSLLLLSYIFLIFIQKPSMTKAVQDKYQDLQKLIAPERTEKKSVDKETSTTRISGTMPKIRPQQIAIT